MHKTKGKGLFKAKIKLLMKKLYAWNVTAQHDLPLAELIVRLSAGSLYVEPPFHPQEERVKWRGRLRTVGGREGRWGGDYRALWFRFFFSRKHLPCCPSCPGSGFIWPQNTPGSQPPLELWARPPGQILSVLVSHSKRKLLKIESGSSFHLSNICSIEEYSTEWGR